jgi:asparagine synthase (glutamine-hydrolysing)
MCGLTGFWQTDHADTDALARQVVRMAERIAHRGPDDSGLWVDAEQGVALGFRRLSIIDLSPAGHQPMLSAGGRYVIVFNGEIYNYLALRQKLEVEGMAPSWRGHSDTEVLLACIEAWGLERALNASIGMFALALWDRAERTLSLARDRIGEKPLYYGWQGETFLFGSELKALRAHPSFTASIDRNALALLLRYNYIPSPHTIYSDIRKLPAGTWLKLAPKQREVEPVAYWSLMETAQHGLANPFLGSETEAVDALEQHMSAAVRGQMVADVPLGALLSGGIDSTTITALMQSNSTQPVRTFTIGFDQPQYDESGYAHAIASHLGTEHTELRLRADDAQALIPQLSSIYDEPFADSSQLPTLLVMQLAKRHVTVALSGDGGDELFGGYNRYVFGPKMWRQVAWMPQLLRSVLGRAMVAIPPHQIDRIVNLFGAQIDIAFPGDKLHKLGMRLRKIRDLDDLYVLLVSEWSDADGIVIGTGARNGLATDQIRLPPLEDPVARMMVMDGLTYLPGDILAKVDRAAMAVSLETRAPFLDRELIEFAWSLPKPMKFQGGKGKWLLRRLLDRYVPRELIERPKVGFSVPLDAWLRGPLRDWAETLLGETRLRQEGFLNPIPIRKAWQKHLRREASYGYRLWSVLMFQSWLEENRKVNSC